MMDRNIWDEHQWEEYFRESDKRKELYHRLFEAYLRDHPPPDDDAPDLLRDAYWETLQDHLAEQMGWDENDDDEVPDWLAEIEDEDDSESDAEDGEEWKSGLGREYPEVQDFKDLPIYRRAFDFGHAVYVWVETVPAEHRESVLVELCSSAMQVAAKLANGHGMGYDLDTLGGNIAQCKRALAAANRALDSLRMFRDSELMAESDYRRLYELGFELRNAVGIYIQDLRERFEKGVE